MNRRSTAIVVMLCALVGGSYFLGEVVLKLFYQDTQRNPRCASGFESQLTIGKDLDQFRDPTAIAVNATGHVYVRDCPSGVTYITDATGHFVHKYKCGLTVPFFGFGDVDIICDVIAINATGYVYILEVFPNRISCFSPSNQFISSWDLNGDYNGEARGIAANGSGCIYVNNIDQNQMNIYSSTGQFLYSWDYPNLGPGILTSPLGIAINGSGEVFIVDQENCSIKVFAPTGGFLYSIGGIRGSGVGEFSDPTNIAINGSGHFFVTDTGNARVQVFSPSGEYLFKWGSYGSGDGEFNSSVGIAVEGSGDVYISDYSNGRVQCFSPTGQFLFKWGPEGMNDLQFNGPCEVAINKTGYLYVLDSLNARVQVFSPSGEYLFKWGSYGSGDGLFRIPISIAINDTGEVYIADGWNSSVQVFSPSGHFLFRWGVEGINPGELNGPFKMSINKTGHVFITDMGGRFQVFTSIGEYLYQINEMVYDFEIGPDGFLYILTWYALVEIYSPSGNLEYSWIPDLTGYILQELVLNEYVDLFCSLRIRLDEVQNYVYILCTKIDQIQLYTRDGTLINTWGSSGYGAGEILGPIDLAINASGYMYVVEYSGNRIQIFAPEPEEESSLIYIIIGLIAVSSVATVIAVYRLRGHKNKPHRKKKSKEETPPLDASLQIEDIIS